LPLAYGFTIAGYSSTCTKDYPANRLAERDEDFTFPDYNHIISLLSMILSSKEKSA
jgi:hypothetical protein